jgi:hypothetical protein
MNQKENFNFEQVFFSFGVETVPNTTQLLSSLKSADSSVDVPEKYY